MLCHLIELPGMMAALRFVPSGVAIILTVLLLPSEGRYVRRGSDITDCSMKCLDEKAVPSLYKVCGGDETNLAELWCDTMSSSNGTESRFHLNTSSGCWTLTRAEKKDSCVYRTVDHKGTTPQKDLNITVIEPVLITNITSNSSRPGEDIAVSVEFSGEETAVTWKVDGEHLPDRYLLIDDNRTLIIQRAQEDYAGRRLRVQITNPVSNDTWEYPLPITDLKYSQISISAVVAVILFLLLIFLIVLSVKCYKMKLKNEKNNDGNDHPEERGRLSGSSADADKEKTMQENLMDLIRRRCRISGYEETPQMEMEERRQDTPPEVTQNGVDCGPYSAGTLSRE